MFKRFTHCTLKQILSISKDWQLAIMLEVVTNISIQHANRKTVFIVIFVVIVNRNWMRIAAMGGQVGTKQHGAK